MKYAWYELYKFEFYIQELGNIFNSNIWEVFKTFAFQHALKISLKIFNQKVNILIDLIIQIVKIKSLLLKSHLK